MHKKLTPEALEMIAQMAAAAYRAAAQVNADQPVYDPSQVSFHLVPIRICDRCLDERKEAFPYYVEDASGKRWDDLCNECFDALQPTTFYQFDDVEYADTARDDWGEGED